ncbi:DUF551 domain-containing protein [Escherichia marmotae]|uniref:DUF551 domain-containing protein n=1 Tax=Escherichia marmotae TaxID=1499973 RepID=A0A370V5J1_9ESCH|nr:DUF551 domain-containing protein [Escherichia marmotae]RDR25284.1 hypothetical protein C4A13_02644 [Escherichia marmotae]RDR30634.1 hypothetical protein C4A11_02712 [Escherichia marmotae]RDR33351.1 hypothetical protein C4A14_02711 [Escherichia marmotae]RDR84892.1 hypothetical protein C4A00_02713 [Escherichia marmotae]RDS12905.1 hypothetical protein C3995_01870 [Escherichia marmotae]
MINRTKLEHILEYARQQRRFGQHCKIPPGDMVEIVEIAMRKAGNYPVTPDGWISCSERIPAQDDWILIYSKHGEYMAGQVQGEYVELSDGTLSWLGNALYWMPLPEPPQEVNRG